MPAESENVKVVVRCRPLNKAEKERGNKICTVVDTKMGRVDLYKPGTNDPPKAFGFDFAYDEKSTQRQVYEETAYPIVEAVLNGYNGTIFAYGQTGTGKTWTMQGVPESKELRGIIPNSFEHVFDVIALSKNQTWAIQCSYLEIYNEKVRDLLAKDKEQTDLKIKQDPNLGVYVDKLSTYAVNTVAEIDNLMREGFENRAVGETQMNERSSRSHSVFIIKVDVADNDIKALAASSDPGKHLRQGRLNLVDLAGSERQSKTGAQNERFVEATKINLSLTALGNVIRALVKGKGHHIPYRDSKLTYLLQDSLGGNAKTVMIATLGPVDYNYEETLSTLRYASDAKQIKNKPKVNEDPKDSLLKELQEQIRQLQAQLGGGASATGGVATQKKVIKKIVASSGIDPHLLESLKSEKEEQIANILAQKGYAEEECHKIASELSDARKQAEVEEEEKTKLAAQIQAIQSKLASGDLQDQTAKQEAEIRRRQTLLEQQAIEEKKLQRELAEKESLKKEKQQKFASLEAQAADLQKKLKNLWTTHEEAKKELEELAEECYQEREDLLENIRELTQQLALKNKILAEFMPPADLKDFEDRAEWDPESEEWSVSRKKFLNILKDMKRPTAREGRPVSEYAKAAGVTNNPRFKNENILTLDLDMPVRTTLDYEVEERRVKAFVNAALEEETEQDVTIVAQTENLPGLKKAAPAGVRSPSSSRPSSARPRKGSGGSLLGVKPESKPSPPPSEFPEARGLVGSKAKRGNK